jgi:hypothetical protein
MASSPFVAKVRDRQRAGRHTPEAHDVRHHHHCSREATGGLTAAATATVAAAGEFAGISLVVGGTPIPVSGFAVLTVICSVVGLVLALVLARSARRPRTAFVRTTIVIPAIARRLSA